MVAGKLPDWPDDQSRERLLPSDPSYVQGPNAPQSDTFAVSQTTVKACQELSCVQCLEAYMRAELHGGTAIQDSTTSRDMTANSTFSFGKPLIDGRMTKVALSS